jgi:hypothetical protein
MAAGGSSLTDRPYYTAALSPAAAAIIGAGVAAARSRERVPVSRTIGLAVIVAGTAAYAAWLVSSSARAPGWLVPAIVAVGIAATGLIVWSLARRRSVPFAAALVAGLVAVSLAPALAQLQAGIRHGLFHLVWISSGTDPRLRWITTHCTQLSKRFYDCVPANAG